MSVRKCWNDEVVSMTAEAWNETLKNIKELEDRIEELELILADHDEDVAFLYALRSAGVDNWDGYELACEIHKGEGF